MRTDSLRLRMIGAAIVTLGLALVVAAWGLGLLFERHAERRLVAELEIDLRQLLSGLAVDPEGRLAVERRPGQPLYEQPFSGRYWQVSLDGDAAARSRSLWDEVLDLPAGDPDAAGYARSLSTGPRGQRLLVVERHVSVDRGGDSVAVRLAAAAETSDLQETVSAFRQEAILALGGLGFVLLVAFSGAVGIGLAPLERLRRALAQLRSGEADRLEGAFPAEVAPLVADLNGLLDRQRASMRRAQARAADLAHGLKTPLTAVMAMAEELKARGETATARELAGYMSTMQGHVERELALTRSAAVPSAVRPVRLAEVAQTLIRTMRRLPRGSDLRWTCEIAATTAVKVEEEAIAEILGNLLDNARKWASSEVRVSSRSLAPGLSVCVCDDGPGVSDQDRRTIAVRGKRLDEAVPGSGFGLAIAAEIASGLGGDLRFETSEAGGLCVELRLPPEAVLEIRQPAGPATASPVRAP